MAYKDLREYISALEREGELQRIKKEVDWDMEVGAIIRRSYDLKSPAPFFEKIKGYSEGYKILGAPLATSKKPNRFYARMAITMGMKPEATAVDIMDEYNKRCKNPIKPVLVNNGPCKENIQKGDEVDLFKFPAPLIHGGDGGRYIGTWHASITKDPDTGWVNWGMYRLMIHDKNTLGGIIAPTGHIGYHYYQKYEVRNRPMEFAVALGMEPVSALISATRLPQGVNEPDIIGALRGEPLELVKCETVDLEVPATSEIVFEGEVLPHERKIEGPFGEYPGYRAGERGPRPVFHVKAITHRNNPILPVSCMGVPIDDGHVVSSLFSSAMLTEELKSKGYPVRMAYSPPTGIHFTVVSTKNPYPYYTRELAAAVFSATCTRTWGYLVIVEDDIDVTNMEEVIWAITTRCHPYRGIVKIEGAPGNELMPYYSLYERRNYIGAAAIMDCTWPKDWTKDAIPVKASFDVMWPKEMQEKVLANWKDYGYKD